MNSWILIILGVAIIIFSFPKIRQPILARLFNEGFVTPKNYKPSETEVIKHAGPNLSIFAIGFIIFFIGIISLFVHS